MKIIIQILVIIFVFSELLISSDSRNVRNKPSGDTLYVSLISKDISIQNKLEMINHKQDALLDSIRFCQNKIEEYYQKPSNVWQYFIPVIITVLAGILALLQVKGNIISSARIEWIENLRVAASELISEVEMINIAYRDVKKLVVAGKNDEAVKLFKKKKAKMKNLRNQLYKVKLYLSPEETKHKELDAKLDEYTEVAIEDFKSIDDVEKLTSLNETVVNMTKSILKEAWEDAKSTKIHEVFKFKI